MKKYLLILLLLFFKNSFGGIVEVPSEMEFAGMDLRLTEEVRRKLQADVDMITRSPKSFQAKVDRADLYFPIIEKIFKEESLPDDFKFLVLQESSLVSDAVSTSNAVGFWQFKKETAQEVGLRVDHDIDERMNIISSSRGAAKYLKKNNSVYFNNWIYALLSYNLGAGGAKSKVNEKYLGANKMTIDDDMHWYVIRFLAHKLAYQNHIGKNFNPPMILVAYEDCKSKSLKEISNETEIDFINIEMYNKWLLKGHVPSDKEYCVILPVSSSDKEKLISKNIIKNDVKTEVVVKNNHEVQPAHKEKVEHKEKRRKGSDLKGTGDVALVVNINKIKAIRAQTGDNLSKLAIQGGISIDDFLRYNDLKSFDQVKPGEYYFLQPKKNKALILFHTVQPNESLKEISQKYGIRIEAIRKKNRMGKKENPETGRVLWLRRKRPVQSPVEIQKVISPSIEIKKKEVEKVPVKIDSQTLVVPEEKIETDKVAEKHKIDSLLDNSQYHIIKQGETLYGISKSYSITIDSLRSWNNLEGNDIKLGQRLVVKKDQRAVAASNSTTIEHVVQQGETLYFISKKYGVLIEEILLWNGKTDTKVSLGEKLIIKK